MKSTSNWRSEYLVFMYHFSSIFLEKNALIIRLFLYVWLEASEEESEPHLWCAKLRSWWENMDGNIYQVVGDLDREFERKIIGATDTRKKCQRRGKIRRLKTKSQKMPIFGKWREKKTNNFINIYVNKKISQENIINLEVTRTWCRSSKLANRFWQRENNFSRLLRTETRLLEELDCKWVSG